MGDYLRVPWATFFEPQLLNEDLLHSVWGGTYATIYFDGHRHFLPRKNWRVRWAGTGLLILGLLPTAGFFVGLARGGRRAWREPRSPDTPLLLLAVSTFAGYVLFTLKNPWFAVIKGSFMLGLLLPFAYFASDSLTRWAGRSRAWNAAIWAWMIALWLLAALAFTFHDHLWEWKLEAIYGPGLRWAPPK